MKTKVVFRKYSDNGQILALFPYEIADHNGNVTCYEHVGQHGAANYDHCIKITKPAKPEEFLDLYQELYSVGYSLSVIRKRGNY